MVQRQVTSRMADESLSSTTRYFGFRVGRFTTAPSRRTDEELDAAARSSLQSSGGLPASSIFANTAYASVLLPSVRSESSSFTQAKTMIRADDWKR